MAKLQDHLRKTFLAGIFAAVPLAVTLFIVWVVDHRTRAISQYFFGREIPVVGIVIAVATIYLCGLIATTLLGKWFLRLIDQLLTRVPGLRGAVSRWKQISRSRPAERRARSLASS